ncbi:Hematological/neurological-like protein [Balamuthia mandrillaris]
MSSGKGHVYGFNIKSAGSSTPSNASSSGASKPAIIDDKLFSTKHVPKKDVEKGIQKGTGEVPKGYGI